MPQKPVDKKILVNVTATEERVALVEHGQVAELVIERPDTVRLVGNIYRGRVVSILPGLQAAFVDIGTGKNAFLHASEVDPSLLLDDEEMPLSRYQDTTRRKRIARVPIEKVLGKNQEIIVQIIKEPISSKGPKATTQISLAGRFLVLVPDTDFIGVSKRTEDRKARTHLKRLISELKPPGVGFIVRTIGLKVSEAEFVKEIKMLLDKWKLVQDEALKGTGTKLICRELGITTGVMRDLFADDVSAVHVDRQAEYEEIRNYILAVSPELVSRVHFYQGKQPLFDKFNIEKDLERSLKRKVWLKCGGYILFDHTEALLAIDVNSGRNVKKGNLEDTIFQTNMEAAREVGRQLRLRDIGGIIVVDFIDMDIAEHRHKIESEVHRVLDADFTATSCTGLSKFGLMEITRKRVRPELQELYTDVCHACGGLGWVFSPATVTAGIDRWLQRAASEGVSQKLTIKVHPAVAEYLRQKNGEIIRMLEKTHSFAIIVAEDEELDQDEYEVFPQGSNEPITARGQ